MMYKEKFIAVIKNRGKILREDGDVIRLPFDSYYSILLKNKNSVKAVANVEVDGEDVLQNHGIIVPSNQSVEITGWMRDMDKSNKFKFIRKTKEIQEFRGDRLDDGLVRIAYRFEKEQVMEVIRSAPWLVCYKGNEWSVNNWDSCYYSDDSLTAGNSSIGCVTSTYNCSAPLKDEGITAKGKTIDQGYHYGTTDLLEDTSHVVVLNLRGISSAGQKVKKVIITRSRIQCDICGRKWKSNVKYCGNCGNYLR